MLGILPYFWRLIPGNPILLRVVATASKRKRDLLTRCSYLGLLIAIVLYALVNSTGTSAGGSLTALAKVSAQLFQNLSFLQLALVSFLAPVFTAGAITQERDSQTYDVLLATPLTNGQIVLGTLLSRVFFVIALLVSGIPVFSITQIFGGVALGAIGMSFLLAASTAMVTGALAIAIATLKVGTRRTIFSFYLFIAVYIVGGYFLDRLAFFHPQLLDGSPAHTSWVTGLHPFLALKSIFNQPDYLPPDISVLPSELRVWPVSFLLTSPAAFYVTSTLTLSLALVIPSIMLLRLLAQTTLSPGKWLLTKLHISSEARTRAPRYVWNNPIAWREAKTKGSAARATVLRYGFTLLGLAGALVLLVGYAQQTPVNSYISPTSYDFSANSLTIFEGDKAQILRIPPDFRAALQSPDGKSTTEYAIERIGGKLQVVDITYLGSKRDTIGTLTIAEIPRRISASTVRQFLMGLIMIEAAVILLVVTNSAASTVTREKEDGTLDLLLTTPITSRYYIWGKLRGLVIFVLPLIAVPSISIFLFVGYDLVSMLSGSLMNWSIFPESVIAMPIVLTILAAFAAITGMNLSLRCRTTVRAVMFSVGATLGICGMLGFCGHRILDSWNGDSPAALAIAAFSPFTVLMVFTDPYQFGGTVYKQGDLIGTARTVLFIFSLISASAYAGIVWMMYRTMVKNFDMTIRKQSR